MSISNIFFWLYPISIEIEGAEKSTIEKHAEDPDQ
jgi:hypothetical protein